MATRHPGPDGTIRPPAPTTGRQRRGAAAEALAARHVQAAGLMILEHNYRRRVGEIDLVAVQPADGTLVFIEVRYRATLSHGGPLASVDARKRARLLRAVRAWLAARRCDPRRAVRIDVIGITRSSTPERPGWERVEGLALRWVRDAVVD